MKDSFHQISNPSSFVTFIADNADLNLESLHGKNLHCMNMI